MLKKTANYWWKEIDLDQIQSWIDYHEKLIPERQAWLARRVALFKAGAPPFSGPEKKQEWIDDDTSSATKDIALAQAGAERSRRCLAAARERPWFVACSDNHEDSGGDLCDVVEADHCLQLSPREYAELMDESARKPVLIDRWAKASADTVRRWYFQGHFYVADGDLDSDDVAALVAERANIRRLKLEKAHAAAAMVTAMDADTRRQPIPREVRLFVWQRDGGRCVQCGAQESLHFDHIIPVSLGGSNTERNLQLLCEPCNLRKGASLG